MGHPEPFSSVRGPETPMTPPEIRHQRSRGGPMTDKQHDERGAVLVEFALVVSLLCLIVFGIITFGILLGYRQNLTQAATEAARAASVQQDQGDQVTAALAAATSALDELDHRCSSTPQGGITCTVSSVFACTDDTALACRTVTVTLDNDQHSVVPKIPLLSAFIPHQLHATT